MRKLGVVAVVAVFGAVGVAAIVAATRPDTSPETKKEPAQEAVASKTSARVIASRSLIQPITGMRYGCAVNTRE